MAGWEGSGPRPGWRWRRRWAAVAGVAAPGEVAAVASEGLSGADVTGTDATGLLEESGALLELRDVIMTFGGVTALSHVDLSVKPGEIAGLIGPNGAGKTTVFNVVAGVFRPSSGLILFQGRSIAGMKRYQVARSGVARTFQNIRLFPEMSALENVMVGADAHHRTSIGSALLGLPRHRREERDGEAKARQLLEFVGIRHAAEESARNLPYGD